jgi:hypothetical protein
LTAPKPQREEEPMVARTIILAAVVAACVSSVVTFVLAALLLTPASRAAPDPQATPQVMRAERFELVDVDGSVLAHLGRTVDGDVGLGFDDRAGERRAAIGVSAAGVPAVAVVDPQGAVAVMSGGTSRGGTPIGGAGILVFDANGQGGIGTIVLSDGRPLWQLVDPNGRARAVISLGGDGAPYITVSDANGGVIWQAP